MTFARKVSLIGIALMSIGCAFYLTQLRFDFDIENLFPKHDEDLAFYQNHLMPAERQYHCWHLVL